MIFSRLSRIAAIATAVAAVVAIICGAAVIAGCSVKYSLSGASIPPEAKTVSIAYFPNNAMLVNPNLSAVFTDKLRDRFNRQTKLQAVDENGDFAFEGEIVSAPTIRRHVTGSQSQ